MTKKFNNEVATFNALSGFFFLRFVCPLITIPETKGLLNSAPSEAERRAYVLVGKVMQSLANGSTFGDKELYMVTMNSFIEENTKFINEILYVLSDKKKHNKYQKKLKRESIHNRLLNKLNKDVKKNAFHTDKSNGLSEIKGKLQDRFTNIRHDGSRSKLCSYIYQHVREIRKVLIQRKKSFSSNSSSSNNLSSFFVSSSALDSPTEPNKTLPINSSSPVESNGSSISTISRNSGSSISTVSRSSGGSSHLTVSTTSRNSYSSSETLHELESLNENNEAEVLIARLINFKENKMNSNKISKILSSKKIGEISRELQNGSKQDLSFSLKSNSPPVTPILLELVSNSKGLTTGINFLIF